MSGIVKSGPLPRYYQLKELLREKVRSGEWLPGTVIPSERELCEQYRISRMTARQSITELVREGLLYREQGRGTFVAQPRIAQQLARLTGFSEDMQARHQRPGARVLTAEIWAADSCTADRLNVKHGHPVFRVRRLRLADAQPLALETSVVHFAGCEQLLDEDLAHSSLYQLLETKYKLPLLTAEQEVEASLAQDDETELLGLVVGDPVLRTRRVTYSERGRPVEYATAVYRGDKYTFYTRIVRDSVPL